MKLSVYMSRKETILGWLLVLLHLLILPLALTFLNPYLPRPLSLEQINLAVFVAVFGLALLIFRKFLWKNLLCALRNLPRCLLWVLIGFGIYWAANLLVGTAILQIDPDFANINDANIDAMLDGSNPLLAVAIIVMVPVSEECMYRGLLFQGLRRLGRPLAYILSMVFFAAIHVVGYIGSADLLTLGLCLLQYLPAGFALAFAYERSDSIFTSIFIHMVVNLIGISAMR